ncbi:MAG: hypothetical protein ABI382_06890 [Nakamurella sp.]
MSDESSTRCAAEFRIVDDSDLPKSQRGKYTHLPEFVDPADAFETVDVSGPPPEPGNEGTEREWVARYG